MRGRKWGVFTATTLVAVTASVMLNTLGSATALQGTVCGDYSLPKGAQVHQLGTALDANGSKIIWIEYQAPGAGGKLTIPFDTIAVTCADPLIRGIVAHVQESSREMIQASCKFVGDLLAGRVELPPGKAADYDRKYAEEWYRTTCLGTK